MTDREFGSMARAQRANPMAATANIAAEAERMIAGRLDIRAETRKLETEAERTRTTTSEPMRSLRSLDPRS